MLAGASVGGARPRWPLLVLLAVEKPAPAPPPTPPLPLLAPLLLLIMMLLAVVGATRPPLAAAAAAPPELGKFVATATAAAGCALACEEDADIDCVDIKGPSLDVMVAV